MNRYIQYMYSYPHKTAYRPLENVNLRDHFFNLEGEGHSLYLHLPFCESKCGYCNLFSITGCSRIQMDDYIDAVLRQIKQYKEMMPRSTSFGDFTIGGGTPLLLGSGQIARIFEAVERCLPMSAGHKIIIETAPNQTDKKKTELLKELGVTRVSMGIQSFDNGELRWLGRNHDSERAREAAELLSHTGFECVNFDFIYGLPGQTSESLIGSLRTALSFSPDEIFLYPLYIKHGVRLEREGRKGLLDSDHAYALYKCGSEYLKENGYAQISMRRFIKRGFGEVTTTDMLQGNALQGNALQGNVFQGNAFQGNAFRGNAFQGNAFQGNAFQGNALQGNVFQGNAFQGNAFRGNAFQGNAFQGDVLRKNALQENILRRKAFPEFSECGLKSALSLGCGGRSYLGRLHTCTPYRTTRSAALEEVERYQRTEDFSFAVNGILLSDDELKRRYVIKHLLILPGISKQAYKKTFQTDVLEDFPIINGWIECGWLREYCAEMDCHDMGGGDMDHGDGSRAGMNCDDKGNGRDSVSMKCGGKGNGRNSISMKCGGKENGRDSVSMKCDGRGNGRDSIGVSCDDIGCEYIGLTAEGLGLSDFIGPQLISEDIREKMLEWEKANA